MGYILLGTVLGGIIWGVVVNKVIENKGYEENWFWWGFFFGFFALIVALTKQNVNTTKVVIESSLQNEKNLESLSNSLLTSKVDISSPIHITSWEIKKDDTNLVLFVDFLNVSNKDISAVMFSAVGLNSFGDKILTNGKELFDVIGQDLSIAPKKSGKISVVLNNTDIRKIELQVKKVSFSDGTIIDNIESRWIDTRQGNLNHLHIDCVKRENQQGEFYSIIENDYWQCVCGFVNVGNECVLCNMNKGSSIKFTKDNIEETYKKYLDELEQERIKEEARQKAEKLKEEETLKENKKREKRNRKILMIVISVIVFGVIVALLLNNVIIPKQRYKTAVSYFENQEYEEAYKIFSSIDKYVDCSELMYQSQTIPAKVGDYISLGQNANSQDSKIEWKVLEKQPDKMLIISKGYVYRMPYSTKEQSTWEQSDVRKWLNNQFIKESFTSEEMSKILPTSITTNSNTEHGTYGGKDTTDKVFLPSVEEVEKYLEYSDRCLKFEVPEEPD